MKHNPNKKHPGHLHVSKIAHAHEAASHDGMHHSNATGEMSTVRKTAGGGVLVGPEECGGKQGSKGLSGADPN